jgi:hypothetical protein
MAFDHRHQPDSSAVGPAGKAPKRIAATFLGQAVVGGWLVWRRRRTRGLLSAVVVDPGGGQNAAAPLPEGSRGVV